jgi:dTDP-glucose 4,6-dehydratase
MRILVTGGAGFIGSNFVRMLLQKTTHEVVVLDKLTYAGNLRNLEGFISKDDVPPAHKCKFIRGDIADASIVKMAMDGVEAVVHFAAESHVDRSILDPQEFVRTNVLGTLILCKWAKKSVSRSSFKSPLTRFTALSTKRESLRKKPRLRPIVHILRAKRVRTWW